MRKDEPDDDEVSAELEGPELRASETDTERPEPDTITMYPVPPVFWKDGEDAPELPQEITTIFVYRKRGMRDLPYIGWRPAKEVWDLDDLLNVYGPGTYQLDGRGDDRRSNIRRIMVSVGDVDEVKRASIVKAPEPPDLAKVVAGVIAAVTTAAAPLVSMWQEAARERRENERREREREDDRRQRDRERDDERHQQQMEFIAKLGAARNDDLVNMLRAQQENGKTSGSASDYQQGQADMVALMSEMRESGFGKEDPESKMIDILGALVAGGRVGKADAEKLREIMQQEARANGSGT